MDTTTYQNPNANYFSTPDVINSTNTANNTPLNLPPAPQDTTNYAGIITAIPTFDQILSQINQTTPAEQTSQGLMDRILGSVAKLGTKKEKTLQAEQQAGLPQFNTQLNDINTQLQALQKEALAIPLQIQEQSTGRGVTAGGVAPIQTGQLRQNAIKSLTLSAIGQTLQGNIANAKATAQRAVDLEFAPLEAELKTLETAYNMNKDILERQDKKRADALNFTIQERNRVLETQKAEKKSIQDIAMTLGSYGVDMDTINKVSNARNIDEAISLAGSKLQDPQAKAKLESIRLDQVLTRSQIAKANYELSLLKEYGGLTPTQYAEKIKAEQKAIANAKDENEKNRLQGEALDKKITLLDSVLNSSAVDSVVGPTPLTRATGGVGGILLRTFTGMPLQGVVDQLTGSADLLIGQTEQFISKEFLDSLINTKAQGGTFGALTKTEQDALTNSATMLGNARVYSGKGEDKQVVGYNLSEKDFKRELQNIKSLAEKARAKAIGKTFDTKEQSILDTAFPVTTSPSIYFQ